tara:strand:+ start:247 stop:2778 length:2532 start_codon:yes stop_codon:yes gene_type:complete
MTNFIEELVTTKFNIFNVNEAKAPINKAGYNMKEWELKTYDELVKEHNYNIHRWGLSLGEQENGRCIMSLDFDVYDKDTKADDEDTKALLTEYLAKCENQNGLYTSSTFGNMNVLVDYTNCEKIKALMAKIGGFKFKKYELEILIKGNQVIPPSQTTCKRTKTLGNPRTFKIPEEPFYVINDDNDDDFTYQFVKGLCDEKLLDNQPKPKNKKIKINAVIDSEEDETETEASDDNDEEGDKFLDLLFNVIKNEIGKDGKKKIGMDNNLYFNIAGALKTNNYPFSVFDRYTNLLPNKTKTKTAEKLWKAINTNTKMISIHTLQNIAKAINIDGYKKWLVKWNEYLHVGILEKGENDIARFVAPYLIQNLKLVQGKWWVFNEKSKMWSKIKEPSATIITFIQAKILEALSVATDNVDRYAFNEEELKVVNKNKQLYNDHYKQVSKSSCCSQIVKFLKEYLCEDDFIELLDNGLYKMVFKNGVMDLKTLKFREGIKKEDYVSKTIPFNYIPPDEDDVDYVKNKLKQICNWNDKHLDYYLSILGYAFTGDSSKEQNFYYHRGQTAENGKSVIFEVLELLMPNYVMKANKDVLDVGADLRKEVATWNGLKLLWLNEVSIKVKDEDLVKAVCDGTSYKYNRLYAEEAVVMPIHFKLFAVSNNTLTIKGDAGVKRRFKLLQHNSQFKDTFVEDDYKKLEFIKDKSFKGALLDEYKTALVYLIMSYSNRYWNDKKLLEYPAEWAEDANEIMMENDKFSEWFYENFDVAEGKQTHKTAFDDMCKNNQLKNMKIKDEITRLKIGVKYDSQKQNYKRIREMDGKESLIKYKGFWVGFQIKEKDIFGEYEKDKINP